MTVSSSSSSDTNRTVRAAPTLAINIPKPSSHQMLRKSPSSSGVSPPQITYARPPTPIPLRPSAPPTFRIHTRLPSVPAPASYPPTRSIARPRQNDSLPRVARPPSPSPTPRSTPMQRVKVCPPAPLRLAPPHHRSRSEGNVKPHSNYLTRELPPIPSDHDSSTVPNIVPFVTGITPAPPLRVSSPHPVPKTPVGSTSRWFDSELELFLGGDFVLETPVMTSNSTLTPPEASPFQQTPRELTDTTDLPSTPCSATFSSAACSTSEAETIKIYKSEGAESKPSRSLKALRWAEIAEYPEQQGLVNIHRLLNRLLETPSSSLLSPLDKENELDVEAMGWYNSLVRHLPQPGIPSERKYTLRTGQEEELEHALRVLERALTRDDGDIQALCRARETLRRLVPTIELRFATLPYHREVQRLKSERAQLKEDRALVVVQLAMKEADIKAGQVRRDAERRRELEEAAKRRLIRREEKRKEREVYLDMKRVLEERSRRLVEINRKIESENQALIRVRELRELQRTQRVVIGGSLRVSQSGRDAIKCWL